MHVPAPVHNQWGLVLEQKVVLPAQTNKLADNELDWHKPFTEHWNDGIVTKWLIDGSPRPTEIPLERMSGWEQLYITQLANMECIYPHFFAERNTSIKFWLSVTCNQLRIQMQHTSTIDNIKLTHSQ